MSNYKEIQKAAKKAYRNRGRVIHVSCVLTEVMGQFTVKERVSGTYRCRATQNRIRGKAAVKAAKRLTHERGYYKTQRQSLQ